MGSSGGGGNIRPPNMPVPQGPQVPYGQTSPVQQPQMSYLGTDPTAMMTGLTPEMMNPPAPPPPVQQLSAGPPPPPQQDMRQLLAMLMSAQPDERERFGRGGGYDRASSSSGGWRGEGGIAGGVGGRSSGGLY